MSHENGDDPEDGPKTYRDYQIAKDPRASKLEENDDPMDPAANFDDWQTDVAKGLLEDLPDYEVKDADGRTPMERRSTRSARAWCRRTPTPRALNPVPADGRRFIFVQRRRWSPTRRNRQRPVRLDLRRPGEHDPGQAPVLDGVADASPVHPEREQAGGLPAGAAGDLVALQQRHVVVR